MTNVVLWTIILGFSYLLQTSRRNLWDESNEEEQSIQCKKQCCSAAQRSKNKMNLFKQMNTFELEWYRNET